MRKQFSGVMSLVLVFLAACLPAMGAPSGLNVIPTADVLDKGTMSLETESDGTGRPFGGGCSNFALLQFGIGYGLEIGADKCTSDSDSWINAKWRMCEESGSMPAVAIGTQAISYDGHSQPYAVATKSFGKMRLHTGFIEIDRKTRWMIGVDHPLGNRVTLQADYINGDENAATFGIAVNITNNLSLTLARSVGNSAELGNGHIVNLAWSRALN